MIDTEDTFYLGELIPQPLVKGGQHHISTEQMEFRL